MVSWLYFILDEGLFHGSYLSWCIVPRSIPLMIYCFWFGCTNVLSSHSSHYRGLYLLTFCHTCSTIHAYHILSHLLYHTCVSHSVTLALPYMRITFCHTWPTIHAYHILSHLAYHTCVSHSVTLGLPHIQPTEARAGLTQCQTYQRHVN